MVQPWLVFRDKFGNRCVNLADSSDKRQGTLVSAGLVVEPSRAWQGQGFLPGTGIVSGSTLQKTREGGARFSDLKVDKIGVYRLVFEGLSLKAFSDAIVVEQGVPSRLSCIHLPEGTRAGKHFLFQRPPVVAVLDQGANFVAISNVPIHVYVIHNSSSYASTKTLDDSSGLSVCKSSLHSGLWIDGRSSANDTSSAISESGLAIFRGLSAACLRRDSI